MKFSIQHIVLSALFVLLFLWAGMMPARAQSREYQDRSILKLNLPALALNTYQLQSEYLAHRKFSLVISARYMPSGPLPYATRLASVVDDVSESDLLKASLENYAVSPEIRYYLGKKGKGRGFYLASFFQIARYRGSYADLSVDFDLGEEVAPYQREVTVEGKLYSLSGGIYIGKQWRFARKFYLDWWIVGGSYGRSNGVFSADIPLDAEEQEVIREELAFTAEYPLIRVQPRVNESGIRTDVESFWGGIRTGLCLGIVLY
ncbi:DUF3575 domain-containing protein [Cyclobacterium xiamenense]|uniref:DUF3575 domain-containing protein n=1 Tax=Cyclobacterium xiamenense TaxID=1297121 RepID=UPI0012B895E5|nr:DUF3575 domain-containing protein [Cyclobacterium xiamenense]